MNLTPEDIEKIVRQVLHTLLGGNTDAPSDASVQAAPVLSARNFQNTVTEKQSVAPSQTTEPANTPKATPSAASEASAENGKEIAVDSDLISATLLNNVLPTGKERTVQSIRLKPSAVVTPAAKDLLRERRIQIVRGTSKSEPNVANKAPPRSQRLVVAGTSSAMDVVGKQICPKQAKVLPRLDDDSAVLRSVLEGLKVGHQAAVVWVDSPHHVCWQAARYESLRPVVVSQWNDLKDAIRDVPANLLILSKKQWTIPALGNATRMFFEHLKKSS